MQRRDFELLSARLAHDLVVDANQMIAKLGELGAVSLVGAGRKTVLLDAANPPHVVIVGAAAARAGIPRRSRFRFVEEESAFVECHGRVSLVSLVGLVGSASSKIVL
jgi:hypothetical protein